ncbi:hypothetical protein CU666_12680 [Pseudomonas syringae pv. actinidifoliorum]|nr:hypothetical protein [Pseudomonas syringae pv. actinidifoliorum]NAT59028.1 hypothetical protein [Pseudomonas syringae pv. actinidifoliorum]
MAMSFPQRVRDNILPRSVGGTLPEAFEEWSFTDIVKDHEQATEVCELCEKESLRYHFEIKNVLTDHILWVGSQCILKFGLSVFEEGQVLTLVKAKKKLNRLTQQMQGESCIRALERLAKADTRAMLSNALSYYQNNKFLSPKYAFVVLWKLKENNIDHSPSFFKIDLKSSKHRNDLQEMPRRNFHTIWPALSSSQRELGIRLGHTAPLSPS